MENGFYAAHVMTDGVRSVHVDEDTVCYMQMARMFRNRGKVRAREQEQAAAEKLKAKRLAERERRKRRELVRGCGSWIAAGTLVLLVHFLGLAAAIITSVACFGAACFKLGCYYIKGKTDRWLKRTQAPPRSRPKF